MLGNKSEARKTLNESKYIFYSPDLKKEGDEILPNSLDHLCYLRV